MSGSGSAASGASSRGYLLDPLLSVIAHGAFAFIARSSHDPTALQPSDDALAAFICLEAATTCRVLPIEGTVYGCPVCLYASRDWSDFDAHRQRCNHARATCSQCNGTDGRHADKYCTGGWTSPVWAKEDFVVPRADFVRPSQPQYRCQHCDTYFTSVNVLLSHLNTVHGPMAGDVVLQRPKTIGMLPRRPFARLDKGVARRLPHDEKRRGRLLYQCPDCCYIFSSWSQWEHHVRVTKHSQPYCVDCNKILGKFVGDGGDHTTQTGHTRVIGTQPTKETHLRLVDASVSRYEVAIDNADAQATFFPGDPCQHVFQCPLPECSAIFGSKEAFVAHVRQTEHTFTTCTLCHVTVSAADTSIPDHPHAIPDLPCELWFLRDPTESCVVEIRESVMLAFYSDSVRRCPECTLVVFNERWSAHEGSDVCAATRGLRAAAWEHHERVRLLRAAKEASKAESTARSGAFMNSALLRGSGQRPPQVEAPAPQYAKLPLAMPQPGYPVSAPSFSHQVQFVQMGPGGAVQPVFLPPGGQLPQMHPYAAAPMSDRHGAPQP